jgi:hypothetical protein
MMTSTQTSSETLSDYEREILDTLLSGADPRDIQDAHYLIDHDIRIRAEPLYHVGAAYDMANPKLIRVSSGVVSNADRAAYVAHELTHLRQGVPRCFLLSSEVEAWQRQWRFSFGRAGRWWWEGAAGSDTAILLEEFIQLPANPWEYVLPLKMLLRFFGHEWRICIAPWRVEAGESPAGAFPVCFLLRNEYADTARRTMKACDSNYLANLLFPWPLDFLFNRGFWMDAREGLARMGKR